MEPNITFFHRRFSDVDDMIDCVCAIAKRDEDFIVSLLCDEFMAQIDLSGSLPSVMCWERTVHGFWHYIGDINALRLKFRRTQTWTVCSFRVTFKSAADYFDHITSSPSLPYEA